MLKNKEIKILFLFFLLLLFLSPFSASALEINYPRIPGAAPPQDFINSASPEQILPLYVLYIFNLLIWISGAIALGVLTYAGIRYLTSAGKPEVILSARNQISSAFLGVLLLLSSFIVLKILNPQLITLKAPELEPTEIVARPEISPPETELHRSSMDTEVPFANIIDQRIFATSTMAKIKANASTTLDIATILKDQSEDLEEKTHQCNCGQAKPKCGQSCNVFCSDNCTCDVCDSVRDDIEDLETKNLEQIDKLKEEQKKTTEEIRILREELAKIDRAKKFMLECRLAPLNSLAQFLDTKNFYLSNKWFIQAVKFWDKIITVQDWGSFYCPVSGTIWGSQQDVPAEQIKEDLLLSLPPEGTEEAMACTTEVPVGEIIDRATRIGYTLVDRLEALNQSSKEMVDAISELHVAISHCSSQMPMCCSLCIRIKGVCIIQLCVGMACPWSDIQDALKRIQDIQSRIEQLVNAGAEETGNGGNGQNGNPGGEVPGNEVPGNGVPGNEGNGQQSNEQKGIIPIIDKVVPPLLEDLNKFIREPMKGCISESSPETSPELPPIILSDCESALRAVGPTGVIQNCCMDEPEFQTCLDKCHLEEGEQKYKKCLQGCQKEESQNLKSEGKNTESDIIATCLHKMNYYCCGK